MILFVASIFLFVCGSAMAEDVPSKFQSFNIVPDVVNTAPQELLQVTFNDKTVNIGDELTPTEVKNVPTISWNADPSALYTICMTDPDAPSRTKPEFREFLHWLVANVPGSDISQGDVLAAYVGSGPPQGTGLHRYVFLVYKQSNRLNLSEEKFIPNTSRNGRPRFSIQAFANKYQLGQPVAGNMYRAQYDDSVPQLHKQLSGQ